MFVSANDASFHREHLIGFVGNRQVFLKIGVFHQNYISKARSILYVRIWVTVSSPQWIWGRNIVTGNIVFFIKWYINRYYESYESTPSTL